MKAIFALFLIVAFVGMAMAGVHHYKVGGAPPQAAPAPAPESAEGGGPGIIGMGINGLENIGRGALNLGKGLLG